MTERNHPRRSTSEQIATNAVAGLLALAFAVFGLSKLTGAEAQIAMFEGWGYPLWFMYVVGATEILAAVLTLVPQARFHGAALIVGLMVGGAATHAAAGEVWQLPLPIMTGAAAGLLAVLHRPVWFGTWNEDSSSAEAGDHV